VINSFTKIIILTYKIVNTLEFFLKSLYLFFSVQALLIEHARVILNSDDAPVSLNGKFVDVRFHQERTSLMRLEEEFSAA